MEPRFNKLEGRALIAHHQQLAICEQHGVGTDVFLLPRDAYVRWLEQQVVIDEVAHGQVDGNSWAAGRLRELGVEA